MVFQILVAIVSLSLLICLVWAIKEQDWEWVTVGLSLLAVGAVASLAIIMICGLFSKMSGNYGEQHTETKSYTLAQGTQLEQSGYKLKFIYTDDQGVPHAYEGNPDRVVFSGSERKSVEVTSTRYEQGSWLFPWGMSTTDTIAIVK